MKIKPRIKITQNPFTGEPVGRLAEPRAPRERVQALSIRDLFQKLPVVVPDEDEGDRRE